MRSCHFVSLSFRGRRSLTWESVPFGLAAIQMTLQTTWQNARAPPTRSSWSLQAPHESPWEFVPKAPLPAAAAAGGIFVSSQWLRFPDDFCPCFAHRPSGPRDSVREKVPSLRFRKAPLSCEKTSKNRQSSSRYFFVYYIITPLSK